MPGSVAPLDLAGVQIPYHFRCPISLELMRDPVTVSTGQTYDRSSIESWVATGNTTCPVTRSPLSDFTLIPNHTLRRLIQEWCVAHRSLGVERIPTPKQPASPTLVGALIAQAASSSATVDSRLAALRRLRTLARDSDKNRLVIAATHHESRAALLSLAFDGEGDGALAMESLAVVSMLPLSEQESVSVATCPDRLSWLSRILSDHQSGDARINATALIETVASGTRSSDLRVMIGSTDRIFDGLVGMLLGQYVHVHRAAKAAIKALFSLCLVKQNRERAVRAGAAEVLVARLEELERGDLERALATVELLCRVERGCEALVTEGQVGQTVGMLVKVMGGKGSERAAEHAAGALLAVCGASEAAQREAVGKGVVTQLLLMVQSECTERAKRKAQLLLKLLRAAWPHHDSLANSDDFQVLRTHHNTFLHY